jgi:7,8-dihydropterin-6-yl-methyl-4-(beta-D-ribofuranosyl)aminobenzene 5'-phosphate synthase
MLKKILFALACILTLLAQPTGAAESTRKPVRSLKITILSTMLADPGIGEWGFAALVEADGHKILFDTGARPRTVLENARELKVDLSDVEDVVLSHFHRDHTGGLLTLRQELMKTNPRALSRVHVGEGIFLQRRFKGKEDANQMIATKADYEATGGKFIIHDKPEEIVPGVWLTGPVPRPNVEKNWQAGVESVAYDPLHETIYIAEGGYNGIPAYVLAFPRTANGNVAPARVIAGSATGIGYPVGLAVTADRVFGDGFE